MALFINQLTLTAIVASEVELRETGSKKTVGNFRVSVPYERDEQTTWESFSVEVWEGTAKACAERLTKGSKVLILGALRQNRWESEDGPQSRIYIRASQVEFLRIKDEVIESH